MQCSFFSFVDNFKVFIFLNFQINRLSKFLEILKIVEVSRNNFLSRRFLIYSFDVKQKKLSRADANRVISEARDLKIVSQNIFITTIGFDTINL